MEPATYRYTSKGSADPPVVREVKWLLDKLSFITLGWWLCKLQSHAQWMRPVIKQVPNALSVIRIPLSLLVAWVLAQSFINGNTTSLWRCLVFMSGLVLLDGIDGPLARQLDAISDFGKAIDPAADKTLVIGLAVSLIWSVFSLQSQASAALLFVIFGWVIYLEIRLIAIARQIKLTHNHVQHIDLPGANIYGKVKFTTQSVALLVAIAWLIQSPTSELAVGLLAIAMTVASVFARLSLNGHQNDLEYLRDQHELLAGSNHHESRRHQSHD